MRQSPGRKSHSQVINWKTKGHLRLEEMPMLEALAAIFDLWRRRGDTEGRRSGQRDRMASEKVGKRDGHSTSLSKGLIVDICARVVHVIPPN